MCLQSYRSSALDKYCTNRGHEQVDIKNYNILLRLKIYVIGRKIGNFNFWFTVSWKVKDYTIYMRLVNAINQCKKHLNQLSP